MVLACWQRNIVNDVGNVQGGAEVTVTEEGGSLAVLYDNRNGTGSPISNPVVADSTGFVQFFVTGGAYRIRARKGSLDITWRYVPIATGAEYDIPVGIEGTFIRYGSDPNALVAASFLTEDPLVGIGIGVSAGDIDARLHISGSTSDPLVFVDDYAGTPALAFRRANGTSGSPTQVLADENMAAIGARGYTSASAFATSSSARIRFVAAENFTGTAQGAHISFDTTPAGSAASAIAERMRLTSEGLMIVGAGALQAASNPAFVTITKNTAAAPAGNSGAWTMQLVGADGAHNRVLLDSFGTGFINAISARAARGTNGSQSALQANDQIFNFSAFGYGATAYSASNRGFFRILAAENWTDSAQGTYWTFAVTAPGAASAGSDVMRLDSTGLALGTAVSGAAAAMLDVRGAVIFNDAGGDFDVRMEGDTDANLFFLDASTDRVGIGAAAPVVKFQVNSTAVNVIQATYTGASGSAAGAFVRVIQDDGAATSSGDRLGGFLFGGAEDASSTLASGAGIIAFAEENWSSGVAGTNLRFETAPTGSATRAEVFRATMGAQVLIGHTTALSGAFATFFNTARFQVVGLNNPNSSSLNARFSNDTGGPVLYLQKSRGTTAGSYTIVADNDLLGVITAGGSDGTDFAEGARIQFEVDGTPGAGDMPSAIVLQVSADGSETPTERFRIASSGIVTTNTVSIAPTAVIDSDHTFFFATYECLAANKIQLTQAEDQSDFDGGGFRDALCVYHYDNDFTDYEALSDQKVSYGVRSVVSPTSSATLLTTAQFKDLAALEGTAIGFISWADRGCIGIGATAIQYGTGISDNELWAMQPSDATEQSQSMAAVQAVISSKMAANDGSHPARGLLVTNIGKRASAVLYAQSAGTDGDDGTFQYGLDFTDCTIDAAGGWLRAADSETGHVGTIIEYDSNDYSYYDRGNNIFGGVIGGNVIYAFAAATAVFGTNNFAPVSTKVATAVVTPRVQALGTDNQTSSFMGARFTNDTGGPIYYMAKSRGTSSTSFTVVQTDDNLGSISWAGADGTDFAEAARIQGMVDLSPGAGDMPGRIVFMTSGDGSESPTERMRLTSVGNLKIGGTANRGTTEGTNQVVLFNGTAPVGALTNGVSLYSASGELRSMDAAGNSTLLSPHDKQTNEWIYHSIHTPSGKGLRIDMERMMRAINERFGWDFVHEFAEEVAA